MTTERGLAVRSGFALCAATFALLAAACAAPVDDTSGGNSTSGATPVKGGSGSDLATGLASSSGGNGSGGAGSGGAGAGGSSAGGSSGNAGSAGAAGAGGSVGEPGLSGYWPFEDTGTSIQDASGAGNDGSLSGGVMVSKNGEVGSALSFAGGDGRLSIPSSSALDFTSAGTIEFWVRLTSVVPGSLITRISKTGDGVRVRTSQGNLQVTFNYAGGAASVTSNPGVIGPAWAHVAIVNDGNDLDLYVNGRQIVTSAGGKLGPIVGDLVVGQSSTSDTAIDGYFDELKWYTIARSAEEICKDASGTWSGTDCQ